MCQVPGQLGLHGQEDQAVRNLVPYRDGTGISSPRSSSSAHTALTASRGRYLDGVVIDEYSEMPGNVWKAAILPQLSDYRGWAVVIGTPKGRNHFHPALQGGRSASLTCGASTSTRRPTPGSSTKRNWTSSGPSSAKTSSIRNSNWTGSLRWSARTTRSTFKSSWRTAASPTFPTIRTTLWTPAGISESATIWSPGTSSGSTAPSRDRSLGG